MLLNSKRTSRTCAGVFGRFSFPLLRWSAGRWPNVCCATRHRAVSSIFRRWRTHRLRSGLFRISVERRSPNQITLGTGILGLGVTLLYAYGYLWAGALLALLVGILDGVDGKLARLKVQMTKTGKNEHLLDYFVEMSWWGALAHHFHTTGQVRYAYVIWLAFFASDSVERVAKWFVKRRVGRSIDDVSRFDRLVRRVAGRRNIYTWLFTISLLIGAPASGFVLLCLWGMATAAI